MKVQPLDSKDADDLRRLLEADPLTAIKMQLDGENLEFRTVNPPHDEIELWHRDGYLIADEVDIVEMLPVVMEALATLNGNGVRERIYKRVLKHLEGQT